MRLEKMVAQLFLESSWSLEEQAGISVAISNPDKIATLHPQIDELLFQT